MKRINRKILIQVLKDSREEVSSKNLIVQIDSLIESLKPKPIIEPIKKLSVKEREREFGLKIAEFVNDFGKETCRGFFDYWAEWNDSNTKMKWEIEKGKKGTFNIKKRLSTWKKREEMYAPKKQTTQSDKAEMPEKYKPA